MPAPNLPPSQQDLAKLVARIEILERQQNRRSPVKLADLADVRLNGLVDTNVLEWVDADKLWEPGTGGVGYTAADLGRVSHEDLTGTHYSGSGYLQFSTLIEGVSGHGLDLVDSGGIQNAIASYPNLAIVYVGFSVDAAPVAGGDSLTNLSAQLEIPALGFGPAGDMFGAISSSQAPGGHAASFVSAVAFLVNGPGIDPGYAGPPGYAVIRPSVSVDPGVDYTVRARVEAQLLFASTPLDSTP